MVIILVMLNPHVIHFVTYTCVYIYVYIYIYIYIYRARESVCFVDREMKQSLLHSFKMCLL